MLSHQWHSGDASQEERWALPELLLPERYTSASLCGAECSLAAPGVLCSCMGWTLPWAKVQAGAAAKVVLTATRDKFDLKTAKKLNATVGHIQNLVFRWHKGWAVVHLLGVHSEGGITEPGQAAPAAEGLGQALCHSIQVHIVIQYFELCLNLWASKELRHTNHVILELRNIYQK